MAVPVSVQIPLFLKILSFDRGLRARVGEEIVIGVAYQERFRASQRVKEEVFQAFEDPASTRLDSTPIRLVAIDLSSAGASLESAAAANAVDVIYVAPLRALSVDSVTAVSRAHGLTTISGVPDYVSRGVAVGVATRADKPQVFINLAAAKAEGCDFHPQLLKLARLVE